MSGLTFNCPGKDEAVAVAVEMFAPRPVDRARSHPSCDGGDRVFNEIAETASLICGTASASVCMFEGDEVWIRASHGGLELEAVPRGVSFSTYTIQTRTALIVGDATRDLRFNRSPLVNRKDGIRAYIGAPIVLSDGRVIGTLCAVDTQPRDFSSMHAGALMGLARAAAAAIEMREAAILAEMAKQDALERELGVTQRLAAVAQHSEDAIIGKSLDSVITSWNLAAERVFGYSAAEALGKSITVLFPPDRLAEEQFLLRRLRAGEAVSQFETVRVRKDGTRVQVSVSVSPIRDKSGRIVAASKVVRDITRRKLQERLLRESEIRYRTLIDGQIDLVAVSDAAGAITFANGSFARFHGVSSAECVGRRFDLSVHPEDCADVKRDWFSVLNAKEVVESESRWLDVTKNVRWMSWTHQPLRNEVGTVFAVHSVGRDVTSRTLAEKALLAKEKHLRGIYEATPAMMYSFDTDWRLLTVSDIWLSKLGYERHEVVGRRISDFCSAHMQDVNVSVVASQLSRCGRIDEQPGELVTKDGAIVDVRFSVVAQCDDLGAVTHYLAVIQDVSQQRNAERELETHRERLDIATEANEVGVWAYECPSQQLYWSDRMFALYGVEKEGFDGTLDSWASRVHPEDMTAARAKLARAIETRGGFVADLRIDIPGAGLRHLHSRARIVEGADGKTVRAVGVTIDITERTAIEKKLAENNELLRVTLESIGDAVITTDRSGRCEWLNPVAERMTGWSTLEAKGRYLAEVFDTVNQDTRLPATNPVVRCLEDGDTVKLHDNTVLISRQGIEHAIHDSASPIRATDGEVLGAILVFRDVSEQRRLGREMTYRAKHDDLTGLVNRTEFEQHLSRLVSDAASSDGGHSLLYIDLDQFKLVNDACGHAAGDLLLKQVASLLQSNVRSRDTLARLGGDEFGILLEFCTVDQARRVADQICAQMEEYRFLHDGRRFRLGTSIGLVPIDKRWTNAEAAMQAADSASYAAKEAGRNRVHVWFDTDEAIRTRLGQAQWGSRLEGALHEGRFELFGQVISPTCSSHEHLAHVEVLLRMREEDGSIIAPGAFLAAAERFHMAVRIDRWVIKSLFSWLGTCSTITGIASFAVNLSGQSISDREFQRYVVEMISSSNFDPRLLCFEITETSAITKLADAAAFIEQIRRLGARVALDDFGAGASSFGYLKSLQVDFLKIDGQFVRDLIDDPLDRAAVRCFTEVAKVIGVKTIAEFVERDELIEPLRAIGVDFVQGYAVHRPQPLAEAVASAALNSVKGVA